MTVSAKDLEKQLKAVSSYQRIAILGFLQKKKTATVTQIAEAIHLHLQSTSQHLRILRAAGIVEHVKRGKFVTYRISLQQTRILKAVLKELL
jgi:DNA-binding transcriptional ArsR family regulator